MLVMEHDQVYVAPFIRKLMPDATEREILEASDNLRDLLYALYEAFLACEAKQSSADSRAKEPRGRFATEGAIPPAI